MVALCNFLCNSVRVITGNNLGHHHLTLDRKHANGQRDLKWIATRTMPHQSSANGDPRRVEKHLIHLHLRGRARRKQARKQAHAPSQEGWPCVGDLCESCLRVMFVMVHDETQSGDHLLGGGTSNKGTLKARYVFGESGSEAMKPGIYCG